MTQIVAASLLVLSLTALIQSNGPAYFIRSLDNPRERLEARAEILDTPVHPGSVVKPLALVAALERGVIRPDHEHMCRRTAKVGGQMLACSHPDLKRPLSLAEALAYSCNDFFVSLAPRLSREALNATRIAAGLPPIATTTPMAAAIVGLDGPKTTPRALVDMVARVAGAGRDTPVPMRPDTRAIVIEGLRGSADYGTASALKAGGVSALAKTGSILMPNGTALGLVVALVPADKPARAIVVAAPGGAGLDAAAIAVEMLRAAPAPTSPAPQAPQALQVSTIRLGRSLPDGRTRVETLTIDAYIAEVLAGEGQPKAADGAQQALAITARTFAIANRHRHRSEGFDLCDTTHCQVVRSATPVTRRAAEATSGRVLLHQGQPAFVFYSAWCGGHTELASQVWPGAVDYAEKHSREDDACEDEPEWTSEVRADQIEQALRAAGLRGSRLRGLRVLARNDSARVARMRIDGFTPPEMSGHEFRMAVGRVAGWQALKSTAFDVDRTGNGYRFRGRGFGHGVGLCVVGAGRRAARGASADEILRFYFPGLTIGSLTSASASARETPGELRRDELRRDEPRRDTVVPTKPATVDVLLALPAREEGERDSILSLIRRSRDEIAKATGVTPPNLRITVHPTVDSFGRATGQPWWVSGATDGSTIDLLPITVLRQQGQLERTVRHEVAHALLDGALATRPMWVREGAAAYFSHPARAPQGKRDRVSCPADSDLLRPISAGMQRDAYARAEACFARAIAEGKRWNEIR